MSFNEEDSRKLPSSDLCGGFSHAEAASDVGVALTTFDKLVTEIECSAKFVFKSAKRNILYIPKTKLRPTGGELTINSPLVYLYVQRDVFYIIIPNCHPDLFRVAHWLHNRFDDPSRII